MSELERHLRLLRDEGSLDSLGDFTTHLGRAREKMGLFQQADQAYCLLRWFQAAVALGAGSFEGDFLKKGFSFECLLPEPLHFGELSIAAN